MESRVQESLERLIESIRDSEVYRDYSMQLDRVKEQPGLKDKIDEFRTRNLILQTGEHTTFEQLDSFEKEFANFREDPLVDRFLATELALCRMLQKVNRILVEAIHFE